MKVTIESTFHEAGETFIGLKEGENVRRVKGVCGKECQCGYPFGFTSVTAKPIGYDVSIEPYFYAGYKRYIIIHLDKVVEEA